jgi:hypothetical protein
MKFKFSGDLFTERFSAKSETFARQSPNIFETLNYYFFDFEDQHKNSSSGRRKLNDDVPFSTSRISF